MIGKQRSAVARAVCSACGSAGTPKRPLRRGRCQPCYQRWVADKPVGLGAVCLHCGERRRAVLQQFELHDLWVVLCRNCAALAAALDVLPRSVDGLRLRLGRDRRWGDRRADAVGTGAAARPRSGQERRQGDRRVRRRDADGDEILDGADLEVELELEADYASDEETREPDGPITQVHPRVDLDAEALG